MKNLTANTHPAIARQNAFAARLNGANLTRCASPVAPAPRPVAIATPLEVETVIPAPVEAPEVETLEYDSEGTFTDNGAPWTGTPATLESAAAHYAAYDAAQKVLAIEPLPALVATPTTEQKRSYGRAQIWLNILSDKGAFHDTTQAHKIHGLYLEARNQYAALTA